MRRRTFTIILTGLACAIAICGPALAQAQAPKAGTAPEARAMLKHAVRALRADKQKALTAFSRGAEGFSQRDLYAFCFGPDGKLDAHPNPAMIGKDASLLKDKDGKALGQETAESGAARPLRRGHLPVAASGGSAAMALTVSLPHGAARKMEQ